MVDCNPTMTPVAEGHEIEECKSKDSNQGFLESRFPFREAVGKLNYLAARSRPDITWIVNRLSQFVNFPGLEHVSAVKRILRYLKGTKDVKLCYRKSNRPELIGHSDADWGGSEDRKSTTGYVFQLNHLSSPISWSTRKQQIVALSTCEAEYLALTECGKEASFLRFLCEELSIHIPEETRIFCDNQAAELLSRGVKKTRSKHIDIRAHFLASHVSVKHVPTKENMADPLTKALKGNKMDWTLSKFFPGSHRGGCWNARMGARKICLR